MAGRITLPTLSAYSMSKHAAIAFSDALRRENQKYGIRVTTIEPTFYNTRMTSKEFLNDLLDSIWNDTSDEVKQVYGNKYFLSLKKYDRAHLPDCGNINEVVDLIDDAIMSIDPQERYVAISGGVKDRIINIFAQIMPNEFVDFVINYFDDSFEKPAYYREENSEA